MNYLSPSVPSLNVLMPLDKCTHVNSIANPGSLVLQVLGKKTRLNWPEAPGLRAGLPEVKEGKAQSPFAFCELTHSSALQKPK